MDHSGIRKSLRIVESAQANHHGSCSCSNKSLHEWAAGTGGSQTFSVGGMEISISGSGSVNINGVEYGGSNYVSNQGSSQGYNVDPNSAVTNRGSTNREVTSRGGKNRPAVHFPYAKGTDYFNDLDPNDPNIEVDVVGVGPCKLIFYGDISDAYKNAMTRSFNSARQRLEAKGIGWLMAVDVCVKQPTGTGVGGYYEYLSDTVWMMPSNNEYGLTHAIIHEFGHRFEYRFPSSRTAMSERYQWCLHNDPGSFPRDYSRGNFGEFWADCFAAWALGANLKPHLVEWVEFIIKTYKR
jgi:hypothetical protein